jgi:hypothetical protein
VSLLKIPIVDRVPGLALKYGEQKIHALIIVMLQSFVDELNLTRSMSAAQVVSCAYDMMISTREDFLSLEDIALFFKNAKLGKYGKFFEGVDQAKLFDMFEIYREERHQAYKRAQYETDQQFKALPVNTRIADMFDSEREKHHAARLLDESNKGNPKRKEK